MSQGDSCDLNHKPVANTTQQAVIDRLTERHEQLRAAQRLRAQQKQQQRSELGRTESPLDFLQRFLQTKTEILSELDSASAQIANKSLHANDVTKLLDSTLARLEEMQQSLNDASLYLTAFDLEQASLELKDLKNQFQLKREQLLPSKKFSFTTRKPKQTPTGKIASKSVEQQPKETIRSDEALCSFDPEYSLVNESDQELILPKSASKPLLDQSVYLCDLTRCTIFVNGVCGNLIARRLHHCRVYTYPVAGSVWIEDCHHCDLVLACRQLRIHQTADCRLGLHMASRPIIEHSTSLQVAPYPLQYAQLQDQLQQAGLSSDVNCWAEVEDFSHPNKRLTTGSPNWSILPEADWPSLNPPSR